jgi:hypothetical protein
MIDEHPESFIVRDATGQALGYFYFEDDPWRRSVVKLRPGGWRRTSRSCRRHGMAPTGRKMASDG